MSNSTGDRIVGVGAFKINSIYMLNNGYYRGQMVKLVWISVDKPIFLNNKRLRQVCVNLINEQNKKINAPISHLSVPVPVKTIPPTTNNPFKNLSNKNLIKLAVKSDNRKIVQEYIRRFKKKPKFRR